MRVNCFDGAWDGCVLGNFYSKRNGIVRDRQTGFRTHRNNGVETDQEAFWGFLPKTPPYTNLEVGMRKRKFDEANSESKTC